jgi:SnoaL-like domain
MHSHTNPVIEIDGDRATGSWLIWVAVSYGGQVSEVFQAEDLTYQRGADGWRIASIALHVGATLT